MNRSKMRYGCVGGRCVEGTWKTRGRQAETVHKIDSEGYDTQDQTGHKQRQRSI